MKNVVLPIALFLCLKQGHAQTCNCFLIKQDKNTIAIEKMNIENNRVEIINDPSVIAPVFSMGEGMNGDMVQKERRGGMIVAQCKEGKLKLKFRTKDGVEKPLPDMDLEELKALNIRVNVVSGDGTKKAFLIENYERIKEDKGPVIDMFGGKLPVQPGDYIITTETKRSVKTNSLNGKASFNYRNGWMVVPVSVDGIAKLNFVVDMAATSSVIALKYLPAGIPVNRMEMIEYSAAGAEKKEVSTQGATGATGKDVLQGKALVPHMKLDGMDVPDVNFSVLNEFPAGLKQMGIAGIIGTDLLMRAGILTITNTGDGHGILSFGGNGLQDGTRIPFTMAGGLFFAEGKVGTVPVSFLLDTGARESIINRSFAEENKLQFRVVNANKKITGIDGNPVNAAMVKVPLIALGEQEYHDRDMVFGDIAALASIGLAKQSAILGMDFFRQFKTVQFDFGKSSMVLNS